jgi:hypothetical protein
MRRRLAGMSTARAQPGEPARPEQPAPDVPEQRRPASPQAARYDLFLNVAGDLDRVTTAYDAELMVSTMLGAAYAVADAGRAEVLAETADGLRRHLAPRRTRTAALLRSVLVTLTAPPSTRSGASRGDRRGPVAGGRQSQSPDWLAHLGVVHVTGAHAFGDQHGDQITYLATFAYDDEAAGGPEHVVAALVDHRLGHVKDLFVAAPAGALLAQLEAAATTDPDMRLVEVDPGELRGAVERYLAVTDELPDLPEARSLTSDRALAAHRLRLLPVADEGPPQTMDDFRTAPEAARLAGIDEESLSFALKLVGEYGQHDPLHWSPAVIEEFLLEWLPARALLDRTDIGVMPTVLSAWVRWAGRVGGLSPRAVAQNVAAVAAHRGEFTRRARSGSHRSPAARAMAELLRDGVDLNDERAVAEWLDDFNAREDS